MTFRGAANSHCILNDQRQICCGNTPVNIFSDLFAIVKHGGIALDEEEAAMLGITGGTKRNNVMTYFLDLFAIVKHGIH